MLKNNISRLMGEKRIKIAELQKLTGLSFNTIRRVYYDESNTISYKTIERLCYALDCSVGDLFEYIPDE